MSPSGASAGSGERREVRWERMFPDELEEAFAECPLLYLPYGLCEPHGPQSALGLDGLKAHRLACESARSHGGIVAPVSFWHIHEVGCSGAWAHREIGQVSRSWLTAVPPWHHYKTVLYHVRAADALGFHGTLLVTGHDAWTEDLKALVELIQPHVGTRLLGVGDWEGNEPGFDGVAIDHAGKVETSLLWALEPSCVDVSRFPQGGEPGPHWAMGPDAREASRRVGARMAADEARWLGTKGRELLAAYERDRPAHRLLTFADVEALWQAVVRQVIPGLQSMQELWGDLEPVPRDSVWHANWRAPSPLP